MMKQSLRFASLCLLTCFSAATGFSQGVSISASGAAPNANAILDIDVSALGGTAKTGLLIPRMTATQRLAIAPVDGLWVFQTNNTPTLSSGLWYYDGIIAQWAKFATGDGWKVAGDVGVATNYAGTADAQPFILGTNATPRVGISATGDVGIGTATPVEKLEVDGAIHFDPSGASSLSNSAGGIRWNTADNRHEGNVDGTAGGWSKMENAFKEVASANYQGTTFTCGPGNEIQAPATANPAYAPTQSSGNFDTPFPTDQVGPGQGSKIQYIFTAQELLAAGLCAGNVTQVAFRMIVDDTQATSYDIQIKMAHTPLNNFSGNLWQDLRAQAWNGRILGQVAVSGWFPINFPNARVFNWNGAQNVIVEVSYERASGTGLSPAALIIPNTNAISNPGGPKTRYGFVNLGSSPGWDFHDNPATPAQLTVPSGPIQGYLGNNLTRPVIRFRGEAQGAVPSVSTSNYALYEGGLYVGNAASAGAAFKGPGVIEAENSVWEGSTQLSDHVFDQYFDGRYHEDDLNKIADYEWEDLADLKEYMATNRHLPNLPSRSEWEASGSKSIGEVSTGLWQTIEQQALYIAELEADLRLLEELAYKAGMSDVDLNELIAKVNKNERLSTEQKDNLIAKFRKQHGEAQSRTQK